MDAETGVEKWRYTPAHSIRNNSIAIGNGLVHLIDRPQAVRDREEKGEQVHPPGQLVTLDAATGNEVWRSADDVYGTTLVLSTKHDVLLMLYQHTRFRLNSELGGRMSALRASDGTPLWDVAAQYESRPVILDDVIYMQPAAWNLLTGEAHQMMEASGSSAPWKFSRSYGLRDELRVRLIFSPSVPPRWGILTFSAIRGPRTTTAAYAPGAGSTPFP